MTRPETLYQVNGISPACARSHFPAGVYPLNRSRASGGWPHRSCLRWFCLVAGAGGGSAELWGLLGASGRERRRGSPACARSHFRAGLYPLNRGPAPPAPGAKQNHRKKHQSPGNQTRG